MTSNTGKSFGLGYVCQESHLMQSYKANTLVAPPTEFTSMELLYKPGTELDHQPKKVASLKRALARRAEPSCWENTCLRHLQKIFTMSSLHYHLIVRTIKYDNLS